MEDLRSQPLRWHRVDGFVCRSHHLVPAVIWIIDSSASPPRAPVARCNRAPDCRMDCPSAHRGIRLGAHTTILIRDRDAAYGDVLIRRLRAMGIRDRPIAPRSPWQNGHTERLIGSIRRDCLDHVVVFSERHLRHLLGSYQRYYNDARTHLSLNKDAPASRAVQVAGRIVADPHLGGLHHQYVRI
jgi:transposase InsO family protein